MAVSIQNILYSVGMNTTGFKRGANEINAMRSKLATDYASYSKQRESIDKSLNKLASQQIDLQNKIADATKRGTARSLESVKEYERQLENLKLRESELLKQRKGLAQSFQDSGIKIGGTADALKALSIAGGVATTTFFALSRGANWLDNLGKQAERLDITASALFTLQHHSNLAGVSTETLGQGLKKLQIAVSKNSSALTDLGVKTTDANGNLRSMDDILLDVSAGLGQYQSNTELAKVATELFGREGVQVAKVLKDNQKALQAGFAREDIDRATRAAADFNDTLENLKYSIMPSVMKGLGSVLDAIDSTFAYYTKSEDDFEKYVVDKFNRPMAKREEELAKLREEQELKSLENLAKIKELDDQLRTAQLGELSDIAKILNLKNDISEIESQLLTFAKDSDEYAERYADLTQKRIDLLKLERTQTEAIAKAESDRLKQAEIQAKREEDAKKREQEKAQADAERLTKSRAEFETQTKIKILESQGRTQEAEQIKNSIERNRLMSQYGYSLEQATRIMQALKDAEKSKDQAGKGGGVQYSEEARAQAQKIVERGEGGTVGKKTLEQAQAILAGQAIEGQTVAMFEGASGKARKAKKPKPPSSKLRVSEPASNTEPTASIATSGTPTPSASTDSAGVLQQILETLQTLKSDFTATFAE